jgi:hypothetical protein
MLMCIGLSGCAASGKWDGPSQQSEAELARTRSCVVGGLPMELSFRLPENPPKLNRQALGREDLDQLASIVDARVSILLEESMLAAWANVTITEERRWSTEFVEELEAEMLHQVADRAAKVLDMEFCGRRDHIGNFVSTLLVEYFRRALYLNDGTAVPWLRQINGRSNGAVLVMIGVALLKANIPFYASELSSALVAK